MAREMFRAPKADSSMTWVADLQTLGSDKGEDGAVALGRHDILVFRYTANEGLSSPARHSPRS